MAHNKRPEPLFSTQAEKGAKCPVCGFKSYSREGIHPQCAQQRADQQRVAKLKSRTKSETSESAKPNTNAIKPWHKVCPKCRRQVHVRRTSCGCGHEFTTVKTANAPNDGL